MLQRGGPHLGGPAAVLHFSSKLACGDSSPVTRCSSLHSSSQISFIPATKEKGAPTDIQCPPPFSSNYHLLQCLPPVHQMIIPPLPHYNIISNHFNHPLPTSPIPKSFNSAASDAAPPTTEVSSTSNALPLWHTHRRCCCRRRLFSHIGAPLSSSPPSHYRRSHRRIHRRPVL